MNIGNFLKVRSTNKNLKRLYSIIIKNEKVIEDGLFELFKNQETGLLSLEQFVQVLENSGIRRDDPRLRQMYEALKQITPPSDAQHLSLDSFRKIVNGNNSELIMRTMKQQLIIPDFGNFSKDIEKIYRKCQKNTAGTVASYIPQLKLASPKYWAVSVCTIDGQRFTIGDTTVPFTVQSCTKPLTYGYALDLLGADIVHKYVGQEPSGRHFNEVVLDANEKPHNPMINAGAILVGALIKTLGSPGLSLAENFDETIRYFRRLAGIEDVGFNNAVYLSERDAADRNYALGFFMREHKCFPPDTDFRACMDYYFQCCSLETTSNGLAVMAATLANGGICPMTEEKVLKSESVRDVLSLMHSCGMYDYSGQFAFTVGLPAKSAVSGALALVIPNAMGICLYSPPLDRLGNSCRGVQFCQELIRKFNFHQFDNLKHATNKLDPRRYKFESDAVDIANLFYSAAYGDMSGLIRQKLNGVNMALADYDGRTALHVAAASGHVNCVQFLLEKCNVPSTVQDRWGHTPLSDAETFKHQDVIDILNK